MNKTQWIAATAEQTGLSRQEAERVLSAALDALMNAMEAHEKIQLTGFGAFEIRYREARMGRNPQTKEPHEIPASWVPVFKPSQSLKDRMTE